MKPEDVNLERQPDYYNVNIPSEKPVEELSWQARRAHILQSILKKGYPDLNQVEQAQKYGVSQQQIHKDIQILKAYLAENTGKDFEAWAESTFRTSVKKLHEQGNHHKAVKALEAYKDFLFETGRRDKEPEKHEVKQEQTIDVIRERLKEVEQGGQDDE